MTFMKQNKSKPRIEREKRVVKQMIELYCKHNLGLKEVSEEYKMLADYACKRLDDCQFGENKKACKKCPIHCYSPQMRDKIKAVMRWSGPRMMLYNPIAAFRHLFNL